MNSAQEIYNELMAGLSFLTNREAGARLDAATHINYARRILTGFPQEVAQTVYATKRISEKQAWVIARATCGPEFMAAVRALPIEAPAAEAPAYDSLVSQLKKEITKPSVRFELNAADMDRLQATGLKITFTSSISGKSHYASFPADFKTKASRKAWFEALIQSL